MGFTKLLKLAYKVVTKGDKKLLDRGLSIFRHSRKPNSIFHTVPKPHNVNIPKIKHEAPEVSEINVDRLFEGNGVTDVIKNSSKDIAPKVTKTTKETELLQTAEKEKPVSIIDRIRNLFSGKPKKDLPKPQTAHKAEVPAADLKPKTEVEAKVETKIQQQIKPQNAELNTKTQSPKTSKVDSVNPEHKTSVSNVGSEPAKQNNVSVSTTSEVNNVITKKPTTLFENIKSSINNAYQKIEKLFVPKLHKPSLSTVTEKTVNPVVNETKKSAGVIDKIASKVKNVYKKAKSLVTTSSTPKKLQSETSKVVTESVKSSTPKTAYKTVSTTVKQAAKYVVNTVKSVVKAVVKPFRKNVESVTPNVVTHTATSTASKTTFSSAVTKTAKSVVNKVKSVAKSVVKPFRKNVESVTQNVVTHTATSTASKTTFSSTVKQAAKSVVNKVKSVAKAVTKPFVALKNKTAKVYKTVSTNVKGLESKLSTAEAKTAKKTVSTQSTEKRVVTDSKAVNKSNVQTSQTTVETTVKSQPKTTTATQQNTQNPTDISNATQANKTASETATKVRVQSSQTTNYREQHLQVANNKLEIKAQSSQENPSVTRYDVNLSDNKNPFSLVSKAAVPVAAASVGTVVVLNQKAKSNDTIKTNDVATNVSQTSDKNVETVQNVSLSAKYSKEEEEILSEIFEKHNSQAIVDKAQQIKEMFSKTDLVSIYQYVISKFGVQSEEKFLSLITRFASVSKVVDFISKTSGEDTLLRLYRDSSGILKSSIAAKFTDRLFDLIKTNKINFAELDTATQIAYLKANSTHLSPTELLGYLSCVTDSGVRNKILTQWSLSHSNEDVSFVENKLGMYDNFEFGEDNNFRLSA